MCVDAYINVPRRRHQFENNMLGSRGSFNSWVPSTPFRTFKGRFGLIGTMSYHNLRPLPCFPLFGVAVNITSLFDYGQCKFCTSVHLSMSYDYFCVFVLERENFPRLIINLASECCLHGHAA